MRPGGWLSAAEVEVHSREAKWLNEFVAANTEHGHDGHFLTCHDFYAALNTHNFQLVSLERKSSFWAATDELTFSKYLKTLFGLRCATDEIMKGLRTYFDPVRTSDRFGIMWQLIYARAIKR